MPTLSFQIPEIDQTVIKPVVTQTVENVLNSLSLSKYFDDTNLTISSDNMVDSSSSNKSGSLRISSTRCDVNVIEVTNPTALKWNSANFRNTHGMGIGRYDRAGQFPIFHDYEAGIVVHEYGSPINLIFEFSLAFKDKSEAKKAESAIVTSHFGSAAITAHDFLYSYSLDKDILTTMYALYKMRTSVVEADTHFVQWLKNNLTESMKKYTSRYSETSIRWAIERMHLNAIGNLEYDQTRPEPIQTSDKFTDRWEVTFRYTVQLMKPDFFVLRYPSVIENELIQEALTPAHDESYTFMNELSGIIDKVSFHQIAKKFHSARAIPLVKLPYYEDFTPNSKMVPARYRPFMIAAVTLDDAPTTSLDLLDIPDVVFDPTAVEIMARLGASMFSTSSLFNITIYSNGVPISAERVSIDENLVLTFSASDSMKRYHLVISETNAVMNIDGESLKILLEYRWFFSNLIVRNLNYMIKLGYYRTVPSGSLVSLLQKLFLNGSIDGYNVDLVNANMATTQIYQVTTTALQYAEYICSVRAPESGRLIYDELMDLLVADGIVVPPYPDMFIKTNRGTNIFNDLGEIGHAYSTPLRVLGTRITAE